MANPIAEQRFTETKTAMLLHVPFFASLMLDTLTMKVGKFPGISTAGTDGKTVWFDEDFLASLDLFESTFLTCHEIGHAMWMHMARGKQWEDIGLGGHPFSYQLYNIAADYVINAMLTECNIGRMPKDGLIDKKYNGSMLVEDVYLDLLKNAKKQPQGGGGSQGTGPEGEGTASSGASVGNQKQLDTHVYAPAKMSEAEAKRAIATAAHHAKAMGKMPAALERWVDSILKPQVNWREKLRKLITRTANRDATTWSRPHRRRLVTQKVFMPAMTGIGAGEMVAACDTSGSMGQAEFDAAWSEFSDIIMTCRPERMWLMACDAAVHETHELYPESDLMTMQPAMSGGGGTSFIPVFEKIEEMNIDPACLVYFTDGYGSFPSEPPKYPVIWVMTTDVEPPFGEVVKVEVAEYEKA